LSRYGEWKAKVINLLFFRESKVVTFLSGGKLHKLGRPGQGDGK